MKIFKYFLAVILTVAAGLWTFLVKTYDVAQIAPMGTNVGFSDLNMKVWVFLNGADIRWFIISEVLGYICLAIAAVFALSGLVQLIKRRSLFKVDLSIIGMGVIYVFMMAIYIGFEKLCLNVRPVIMPGEVVAAPSYPSSHTMMVIVIMGCALFWLSTRRFKPVIKGLLSFECIFIIVFMIACRTISGVHWITDIIGGILIAGALVFWYGAIFINGEEKAHAPKSKHAPKH